MSITRRYCLACDLKDDPELIQTYEAYHAPGGVWPEILESLKEAGIQEMQIYRVGNRLFMIIEVDDTFSFERKQQLDDANPKVVEWEALMAQYQQQLPWAAEGVKWMPAKQVFQFPEE
ncbi:MAG: L-rhamnose mutarotase [Bacteroidota bacterium]